MTIFVFLQDWRATLIPAVAIPVSLIGTFAVMASLGFSINMLTLFGLVLAIGIVVDDAIVVVENVTRLITRRGLSAREAALRSSDARRSAGRSSPRPWCCSRSSSRRRSWAGSPAAEPAVRAHDRGRHRDQLHQRADAQPGPRRDPAAPDPKRRRSGFFGAFNRASTASGSGYVAS